MKNSDFSKHLTEFLGHYLPELKDASPNTISGYCDSFRLFLTYCQDKRGFQIEKMSVQDLSADLVDGFLDWLNKERENSVSTRNNRLAAIHSFVRYLQAREPQSLLNFQQILAIPVRASKPKPVKPLSKESLRVIFRQPDTSKAMGRRDLTILCFLYDTGVRVSELCDLRIEDVRFDHPTSVRITGKGKKIRIVPVMPATAQNLKNYLAEHHMLAPEKSHLPLFTNRDGKPFTRSGVTYILDKYIKAAAKEDDSIPEHVTPHMIRHTKAMHLYEADQNLIHVRDFLGHSDIKTTGIYARSSLEMKRKALEKISNSPTPVVPSWLESKDTLDWLKKFGSQK